MRCHELLPGCERRMENEEEGCSHRGCTQHWRGGVFGGGAYNYLQQPCGMLGVVDEVDGDSQDGITTGFWLWLIYANPQFDKKKPADRTVVRIGVSTSKQLPQTFAITQNLSK